MNTQQTDAFNIIGIAIRTTNENGQSAKDIPVLWSKFMSGGVMEKIPNKINNTLYCVYTAYEKDHTKPYTTILGCRVAHLDQIPNEMTGIKIEAGNYICYPVNGNLLKGAVFEAWVNIWNMPIERMYTADFEVYGEKAQNPANGEMEIFIAVK